MLALSSPVPPVAMSNIRQSTVPYKTRVQFRINVGASAETSQTFHGRSMYWQPRPWWMGLRITLRRSRRRNVWVRTTHDQQSDGIASRYRRVASPEGTLHGHDFYRFAVRSAWRHGMARQMEGQRMEEKQEHKGQPSRPESGIVDRIGQQLASHTVQWQWVKGHAEDADNLRCDALANRAAREQIASNGVVRL